MAGETDIITSLVNLMNSGRGAASGSTTQTGGSTTTQSGGGGTSSSVSTMNPGDTTALRALLAELGGADYQGVLESIFSQAGGKIPGFTAALGNSMGARSGGNSAINAMLQKLLVETALQGQQQTADLGLRNANIRAQLGANIAQATRGTRQTQRTVQSANPVRTVTTPSKSVTTPAKEPYGIGEMAGLLAVLSGAKGIYGEMKKGASGDPIASVTSTGSDISSSGEINPGAFTFTSDGPGIMPMGADNNGQILSFSGAPNYFQGGPSFVGGDSSAFSFDGGSSLDLGSNFDWGSVFDFGSGDDQVVDIPALDLGSGSNMYDDINWDDVGDFFI